MQQFATNTFNLFRAAIVAFAQDRAARQAAALAYYGILSLAPLLIIAISIAGIVFSRSDIEQQLLDQASQQLGSGAADLLETILTATYADGGGTIATVLSLLLLVFAATNLFAQLKMSLNRIWHVEQDERAFVQGILKLIRDRLLAFVMVIGVGLALLLLQIVGTAISVIVAVAGELALDSVLLVELLNMVAVIAFAALVVALIFRYLPDERLGWGEIWIGAVFTAVLFLIGQRVISLYIQNTSTGSIYGVAGSFIIVLLWIYYSAAILLFGAEFTHVYAHQHGSIAEADDASEEMHTNGRPPGKIPISCRNHERLARHR